MAWGQATEGIFGQIQEIQSIFFSNQETRGGGLDHSTIERYGIAVHTYSLLHQSFPPTDPDAKGESVFCHETVGGSVYAGVQSCSVAEGNSNADMTQDLLDLVVIGREDIDLLKSVGFETHKLEPAAEMSQGMADLHSAANADRRIRDAGILFCFAKCVRGISLHSGPIPISAIRSASPHGSTQRKKMLFDTLSKGLQSCMVAP